MMGIIPHNVVKWNRKLAMKKRKPRNSKSPASVKTMASLMPQLEHWFSSKAGEGLLQAEQQQIDELLTKLFGYHLMQISSNRDSCLYAQSKIRHRFALGPLLGGQVRGVCDEELPLENESIDVAVLHHVMEYSAQPHILLREVSRVVVPSGYVMIIGFNPWSIVGLLSLRDRLCKRGIWQKPLFHVNRLVDWLAIMDFSVQSVQYGHYRVPVNNIFGRLLPFAKFLQCNHWPLGSFYIVLAKKEVSRLTPVHLSARLAKAGRPVVEASFYTEQNNKKTPLQ